MTLLTADWGNILNTAGIGFALVVCTLLLMVFIMIALGRIFTASKQEKAAAPKTEPASDAELAAAIATALKIYTSNLHDRESDVITIRKIKSVYSPWSSKIHGLTHLPDYKRK